MAVAAALERVKARTNQRGAGGSLQNRECKAIPSDAVGKIMGINALLTIGMAIFIMIAKYLSTSAA
jgi:hypothetical protein